MRKKLTFLLIAILASLGAMASPPHQDEGNVAKWNNTEYATLQAALDSAETANPKDIVIYLLADASLDIKAWSGEKNPLSIGTANTQSITINGNNHKLDFVNKNSDWNNVATMNDAQTKLILNNMALTNSGHNDGPWNRHDINFNCAVELNNVTSDKALAFKNSATLNDVTVTENGDVYSVWIQANGQTVDIDGLKVTAKNGRGIKVDDQYVDDPSRVTLNIANSTFTTAQKAAILVDSKGGVDVNNNGGNNIDNVAADNVNLVWVDSGSAANYTLFNVNNATKTPESKESDYVARLSDAEGNVLGYYGFQEDIDDNKITIQAALENCMNAADTGYTVTIFKAGNYTMPGLPKNITVEAAENVDGVVFNHTASGNVASVSNGATFKNLTFNFGNNNYHGFQQAGTINMEGCTLNGKFFSYGAMNFTDCAFKQTNSDYHMWCYDGDLTYSNCIFTNEATGKFLNVYNEGNGDHKVTVTGCKFVNKGSVYKAALNVKATCGSKLLTYDVYIKNCTTEGAFPVKGDLCYEEGVETGIVVDPLAQVDDRTADGVDNIQVWKDDVRIYPLKPVAKIGEVGYPTLQAAVDAAKAMGGEVTINIVSDITGETVTIEEIANFKLTIDGKKDDNSNYTLDGIIVVDGLRTKGGKTDNGASVALQNIAFVNGDYVTAQNQAIIQPSHYPHHLTIQDCTYTGKDTAASRKNWFVNITDGPLYGATVKNVTVEHSRLIQGNLGQDVVFEKIVATNDIYSGINIKTEGTVLIKDCQITTSKYAFRDYTDDYVGTITLEKNTFISTSEERDEGAIVNRGGANDTAKINVKSGTYVGDIKVLNNKNALVISGGHFSAPLGNSEYSAFIAEGFSGVNGIYLSETPKAPNGLGDAVATLTSEGKTSNYASLEAAFADAADGATITLLKNCAGNGIKAPQGKFTNGLTVDFGGFTYTMDGSMVGSTGTETQAFQLLKDNNITFKNGTITSDKAYMLIQNYSNLTLQGMTLTLNNKNYSNGYTLSNNNGNVTIDNSTINANTGGGFAFDVCRYATYPSVSVTVKGGSTINGDVEVSASNNDAKEGFLLMLEEGSISGNIVLDESAKTAMAATPKKALVREFDSFGQAEPDGYKWEAYEEGKSQLVPANYIAQVENKKYETFDKAVTAAAGTKVIVLLKDIADTYAMTAGETLKVQKDGKAFNDPTAPADFTLKTLIDGAVTIYSVKANENLASISEGYYHIKNLGNGKYVNVKGRRTATVDATADDASTAAGTIIKVKANANGQVEVLRSQAIDIPHYADRAMSYVHDFAKILVEKLNASGSGEILGTTGYEAIMKKFDDNFDHHLYVEQAKDGYRIFGRTPSMKPVVEFYQENKDKVDAKLPMLEQKINDAIAMVVDKVRKGYSFKGSFKLHTIWQRMNNSALTEPNDDATKLEFLQQVLSSEINVWNFAYESATFYMEKVEGSQYFEQIPAEIRNYWNLAKQVHPDFKYYIVQKDGKMDFISEGNTDIINNKPRTVWALEPVTEFKVNIPETNSKLAGKDKKEYYTTIYTDFGYQLPEGVTALKVTEIKEVKELGLAVTEEIGSKVAPQTPVLIKSETAGDITLKIDDNCGTAVTGNLLHGADWLINEYEINTPALERLFALVEGKVSKSITDKYEHLLRRNSGTVNNKYFFPISVEEDLAPAYKKKNNDQEMKDTPIRILGKKGKFLAFNDSWDDLPSNAVFLFNEDYKPVFLNLIGDVDRDGDIDLIDVNATIDIVLGRDVSAKKYDFEAADVHETFEEINLIDVNTLIDLVLNRISLKSLIEKIINQ